MMEIMTKFFEILDCFKDQSAAGNIVHAAQLHARISVQFVEYSSFALVTLSNNHILAARSLSENCLERVDHVAMSFSPNINCSDVILRRFSRANALTGPVDYPARPTWKS